MSDPEKILDFRDFQRRLALDVEYICLEIVRENRDTITVKKEQVAARNMMRILEAVFTLSGQKGFQAMTLRDLSRVSGLSMGALYACFPSKEVLRSIIHRKGVQYARKIILEQIEPLVKPAERLAAAIQTHLFLSEILRPWFYFAYMEAASLPAREKRQAMEDERATERIFRNIIEDGARHGAFQCENIDLAAAVVKAMLQDWYLKRWKYKRKGVSVEAYGAFLVNFVLKSLSGR